MGFWMWLHELEQVRQQFMMGTDFSGPRQHTMFSLVAGISSQNHSMHHSVLKAVIRGTVLER